MNVISIISSLRARDVLDIPLRVGWDQMTLPTGRISIVKKRPSVIKFKCKNIGLGPVKNKVGGR